MLTSLSLTGRNSYAVSSHIAACFQSQFFTWARERLWPREAPPGTPYLEKLLWEETWKAEEEARKKLLTGVYSRILWACANPIQRAVIGPVGRPLLKILTPPEPDPPADPIARLIHLQMESLNRKPRFGAVPSL